MDEPKSGALRGELQVKTFILYLLRHFDRPLPSEMLYDLAIDRVSDRLEFTSALGDLAQSRVITLGDFPEGYALSPLGSQTLEAVENELPASLRRDIAADLKAARTELERRAEVGSRIEPDGESYRVTLTLGTGGASALEIATTLPSEESAARAVRTWHRDAHTIYKELLKRLS